MGGTVGAEDDVEAMEWRNKSSVAIEIRGVMSTVLVGLAHEPSAVDGRWSSDVTMRGG